MSDVRGVLSRPANRFRSTRVLPEPDVPVSLATEIRTERCRSAIVVNGSPDVPFEQSVNPYRGCEHGCVYCFARPSHAFLDLSPGLDFETRLLARPGIARQLERELARPGYRCRVLAVGPSTDAYQPIEARFELSRAILEVCLEFRQPVALITKSTLILRDLDLLGELASRRLVQVAVSLTSLDRRLKRSLEPRAAAPGARLRVIETLAAAGVPVGALLAPVIPHVNDQELEALLAAARDAGAGHAGYVLLRLPREVAGLFEAWLREHLPDRAERVLKLLRESHGGELYDPSFGRRMRGSGPVAELIGRRFEVARGRLGLAPRGAPLDCGSFRVPARFERQLSLF